MASAGSYVLYCKGSDVVQAPLQATASSSSTTKLQDGESERNMRACCVRGRPRWQPFDGVLIQHAWHAQSSMRGCPAKAARRAAGEGPPCVVAMRLDGVQPARAGAPVLLDPASGDASNVGTGALGSPQVGAIQERAGGAAAGSGVAWQERGVGSMARHARQRPGWHAAASSAAGCWPCSTAGCIAK